MLRFPNRTAQSGLFMDDDPNYAVDLASGVAVSGMRTFSSAALSDGWSDQDQVGVLITKTDGSYKVWTATWDATESKLVLQDEEETYGTFSDSDAVTARAVITTNMLRLAVTTPEVGQFILLTGASYTAGSAAAGKTIRCTSSSAVTITLDSAAAVGTQLIVIQEGAGSVSIQRDGTDTINGGASPVSISGQWKSAYCYQHTEGQWGVLL